MPRLTIAAGSACLSSGDTLMIQNGTYAEYIDYNQLPSGTSATARTTIKAANRLGVILRPTTGTPTDETGNVIWVYGKSYISFDGLVVDAGGIVSPLYTSNAIFINNKSNHIRIENSELKNAVSNCLGIQGGSQAVEVINNKIHDCGLGGGRPTPHGVYAQDADHLIEGNEIYNSGGYGIHQYKENCPSRCNRNVIRYNYVHDNGNAGILIGSGDNNIAYNNTVTSNRQAGIVIGYGTPNNNRVYDNKIYFNRGDCVFIRRGSKNSKVNDNICWRNGSDTVIDQGSGSIIIGNRVTDPLINPSGSPTSSPPK
jgi:parallel beta-helix repeat protein